MSELRTNKIQTSDTNNVSIDNALGLKSYDTSGRDALTSVAGDTIFNTSTAKVEYYDGSAWQEAGGVSAIQIEYAIIAGGGAGGYRTNFSSDPSGGASSTEPPLYLALNSNYTFSVGAGGVGNNNNYGGSNGNQTICGTIIAEGGGRGGARSGGALSGGCGGGSTNGTATNGRGGGADGTTGQGFDGGGGNNSNHRMGGGGGTGGLGYFMDSDNGEDGGEGTISTILTTTQANSYSVGEVSGSDVYFGGGGGSGRRYAENGSQIGSSDGSGGLGGGGNGAGGSNAQSGTTNTGGGGGATANQTGGNGGSGVIIIRFPESYSITGLTGLTSSNFTSGGYKYYVFTQGASSTVQFS